MKYIQYAEETANMTAKKVPRAASQAQSGTSAPAVRNVIFFNEVLNYDVRSTTWRGGGLLLIFHIPCKA